MNDMRGGACGGRDMTDFDRLGKLLEGGSLDGQLRFQRDVARTLYTANDRVLQSNSSMRCGYAARFVEDDMSGFAACGGEDEAVAARMVAQARDNLGVLSRVRRSADASREAAADASGVHDFRSARPRLDMAYRHDLLGALTATARRCYPELSAVICGLEEVATEKKLVTTDGGRAYTYVPRTTLVVNFDLQRNAERVQASETFTLFGEAEERAQELSDLAAAGLEGLFDHLRRKAEGKHPEIGEHDVIIAPGISGLLAHEAVGHPCEADHVMMGSAVAHALGRQVASEKVTMIDQAERGRDGRATAASYIDDEGTRCSDVTLIREGILSGFLHSKHSARLMGGAPCGNARAGSYADEPLIRMRNTAILPGADTLGDMLSGIRQGYLLERPGKGQADLTGDFTFGVTRGYEIVHGTIGRAIRNTTVSGNAFRMLKSVTHVGDDFAWMPSGWCSKGQSIPVSMGGPSLKCRLRVGGR